MFNSLKATPHNSVQHYRAHRIFPSFDFRNTEEKKDYIPRRTKVIHVNTTAGQRPMSAGIIATI